MQFGSIFKMKPKPGKKQELLDLFAEEGNRKITGYLTAHAFDCGDEVWGVAIFADEKSYRDNANDPAQDKEYRRMRDLLEADPEWHDGTVSSFAAHGA